MDGADENAAQSSAEDGDDDDDEDGGLQRSPANPDHGILTTKDGTPLIRLRSKKSIMESRFKLTMRTWDDVWKSTAWAKFAPDKLKHTLQRSTRNQGELKAGGDAAASKKPTATAAAMVAAGTTATAVPVKKSRFRVHHVQIDDQPSIMVSAAKRSPKPALSSSSGSSDTDSDRLPAGLPMIESNLNELTMVESQLKKLEREHEAKHQLLTPKNDGGAEKSGSTADDGGHKQQHQQQRAVGSGAGGCGDGKKDKVAASKVGSRAAETHSKRLGWLKAFRRKSSADTSSDTAAATNPPVAPHAAKPVKHKQQAAATKSSAGGRQSSSPRQPQKQRASSTAGANRSRQQRATAVPTTATPVSNEKKMARQKIIGFLIRVSCPRVCVDCYQNILFLNR